jgi:Mrp family chromosome partitioning ATPase
LILDERRSTIEGAAQGCLFSALMADEESETAMTDEAIDEAATAQAKAEAMDAAKDDGVAKNDGVAPAEGEGTGAPEEECTHECSGCGVSGCGDRVDPQDRILKPNGRSTIKHVIGVVSGKGGVGKSFVTSLLACAMRKRGYTVGILDADVTGPSIPKAFGVEGHPSADADGINPMTTEGGIGIISTNLLLPEGDMPVAWRGPVVSGIIKQFFNEVNWGDIDYLFVDMPPGTSDVMLTVFQTLPIDGIVTVSAPQDLVAMIVGKAVNLAKDMDVEVLGLVENMAYFVCGNCAEKHYIFGKPQGAEVAKRYAIDAYASLPLDPAFAAACDAGKAEEYKVGDALDPIIARIEQLS